MKQIYSCLKNKPQAMLRKMSFILLGLVLFSTHLFAQQKLIDVDGKVLNDEGNPLLNATVMTSDSSIRTLTNAKGEFSFKGLPYKAKLTFSYLGFRTETIVAKTKMFVRLDPTNTKKRVGNNTGSANTYSGEQLKQVGDDIISSLKRLEITFDPDQRLFILDGFETTLQTITNLDINRVASVVILKDAISTISYGPKGVNGVVVVETVRP